MSDAETLCTFTLNGLFIGIGVGEVHEVLLAQSLNPVPLAHPVVAGLINMRGQIVTAIDLRRVLQLPARTESDPAPSNVIVRSSLGLVSLLVDHVGDVLEIESHLFTPPPDTTPPETRNLFRGAYQLPEQLLLVFDTNRAIEAIVSLTSTRHPRQET
jgi:purine-binding chemotaxis protein CheW